MTGMNIVGFFMVVMIIFTHPMLLRGFKEGRFKPVKIRIFRRRK